MLKPFLIVFIAFISMSCSTINLSNGQKRIVTSGVPKPGAPDVLLSFGVSLSQASILEKIILDDGFFTTEFTVYAIPSGLVKSSGDNLPAGNYKVNLRIENGSTSFENYNTLTLHYSDAETKQKNKSIPLERIEPLLSK